GDRDRLPRDAHDVPRRLAVLRARVDELRARREREPWVRHVRRVSGARARERRNRGRDTEPADHAGRMTAILETSLRPGRTSRLSFAAQAMELAFDRRGRLMVDVRAGIARPGGRA